MKETKEKEKMRRIFWEQFPKGTEQFAFDIEEHILQAMYGTGKKEISFMELHNAIGVAVGHFLQVACQIQGYICEKELKALLNNAIKKSFEHYKDYPTWPED